MIKKFGFSPMLAGILDLEKLEYPVYIQPKYDGHRVLIRDGICYSRKMEVIRNRFIQEKFGGSKHPLDGELISNISFEHATSVINSFDANISELQYKVYDLCTEEIYTVRLEYLRNLTEFDVVPRRVMGTFGNE